MKKLLKISLVGAGIAFLVRFFRQQAEVRPAATPQSTYTPTASASTPSPVTATPPATAANAASASDDLTRVKGIGPVYAQRLGELGITSFADLASADPGYIEEKLSISVSADVSDWIAQAKELAGGS